MQKGGEHVQASSHVVWCGAVVRASARASMCQLCAAAACRRCAVIKAAWYQADAVAAAVWAPEEGVVGARVK